MKSTPAFGIVLAVLGTLPCFAQENRFYLKTDLGGIYAEDATLQVHNGPAGNHSTSVSYEAGGRLGLTAGYALNRWMDAELSLAGAVAILNSRAGNGVYVGDGSELAEVPLLAGLSFQYPTQSRWSPYGGFGVGAAASIYNTDGTAEAGASYATSAGGQGIDADAVFAYQAFIGMRYNLSERVDLGLEYRLLGTEGTTSWGIGNATVSMGAQRMHSLSFTFDYKF